MIASPLLKYEFLQVLRGRWLPAYAGLFAAVSLALLEFGSEPAKAVASLMGVVLLVVPMVSALYSAASWYHSEAFTSLLLTQPVRRDRLYLARWAAISGSLSLAFVLGVGVPLALTGALASGTLLLLGQGVILTGVFSALGLMAAVLVPDRMRGIGVAFGLWFYFSVAHDGLLYLLFSALREYPLEVPAMALSAANPIDLARISLLLALDYEALMGYTGVLLQRALSGPLGQSLALATLAVWLAAPILAGVRTFKRRDL